MNRSVVPIILLAVLFLLSAFPAMATSGAGADADTLAADYEQLGKWEFSAAPVPLPEGGVRLQRDTAEWVFESGTVRLMRPTSDGSVTGLVFEGQGHFRMTIPDQVEVNQLSRFLDAPLSDKLTFSFNRMVLRTTDDQVMALFPSAADKVYPANPLAGQRHLWWLEHARFDADARVIAGLLNGDDEYLAIDIDVNEQGWLFYEFDPWRMEEVRLCRMRKANDCVEVWVSLDRARHRRADGRPGSERTPLIDLVHADLEVDLMGHKRRESHLISRGGTGGDTVSVSPETTVIYGGYIHQAGVGPRLSAPSGRWDRNYPATYFQASMEFMAQAEGLQALPLRLTPWALSVGAADANGNELTVLRAPIGLRFENVISREEDTSLVVVLGEPLALGESVTVSLSWVRQTSNYPGLHSPLPVYDRPFIPYLAGGGQDWYPPLTYNSGRYWYPEPLEGRDDRHTARVTIVHPKRLRVRGTGQPMGSRKGDGRRYSTWESETPIKSAAFSYGHRYKERRVLLEGLPEVIAFGPNYWKGWGDETEATAAYVADCIQYFQSTFAFSLPLDTVTCTSVGGDSQLYSNLIALRASHFGCVSRWWYEKPMARLTAQLFWGEMLDWESYRDKWLCSALVEYSASMYLEAVDGLWGPRRERAIYTGPMYFDTSPRNLEGGRHFRPPSSSHRNLWAGPLELGFRDIIAETVYPAPINVRRDLHNSQKRTSVLHMLRGILRNRSQDGSDEQFIAILADFLNTHAGNTVSTRDFIAAVERNTGEDWDWFFDQWVYGTDVPSYEWAHTLAAEPDADGLYLLEISLEQHGVSEDFRMPVTFGLEYGDAEPGLLHFEMDQPTKTHTVRLPNRPVNITFDPNQELLFVK